MQHSNPKAPKLSKLELAILRREACLELGRRNFWEFCKLMAPDFYKEDRWHLKKLCSALNDFYYGRLVNEETGRVYRKIMINMPPQHGKSRTLILFCQWVFGKKNSERIISTSYNDVTASDFSRYTRDGIQMEKSDAEDIVYSDVFPDTKIKKGNSGFEKWALEGQHFNYLGAGVGGSITSKGATILIVDDPIKGAIEALNENLLEKIWTWYTSTFLSRVSAEGGEPLEIVNMTRWSKKDICGRLLSGPQKDEWYVLKLEAYDEKTDSMLCPELLSKKRYLDLKGVMLDVIFRANYHQEPIDLQGRLYKSFKTYTDVPKDPNTGKALFEAIRNYTDTADQGNDYLCSINYGVYKGQAYILDVLYTKEGMEITEPLTADFLVKGNVNKALIESNNGGRGFARNVERLQWEKHKTRKCVIKWFHQSENKIARIISNSAFVMNNIYFPVNWKDRWPEYYDSMTSYQKEGKNLNDDAEDATSGVAEQLQGKKTMQFFD